MSLQVRVRPLGKRQKVRGNMNIEVLISAMNVCDISFYKRFNLSTDCLIINQTDHNSYEEVEEDGFKVRMISTDTRGLGRSRNLAILNSRADVVLFCDDDEVLEDDYERKIKEAFIEYPDVDFFVMKTIIYKDGVETIKVKEEKDLKIYNALRYGSVHFAFKREKILEKNIFLSTYFGAGTGNGSGEDSIFIADCIRNKLRVRTSTKLIAKIYNDDSTWFTGFDEKFFYDKGKLSRALFPNMYRFYIEYFVRNYPDKVGELGIRKARQLMIEGAKDFGG